MKYKWLEARPACLPLLWASPPRMRLTEHREGCRLAESGCAFDNVFVERGVASGGELLTRLARLRGLLADPPRRPVRLLVIDSVAHLFRDAGTAVDGGAYAPDYGPDGRGGGGAGGYGARAAALFRLAALLKLYADEFGLTVVVTNQARAAAAMSLSKWQRLQPGYGAAIHQGSTSRSWFPLIVVHHVDLMLH